MKTILLIGSGRVARHLNHWFSLNSSRQHKLLTWDRHQDPHLLRSAMAQASHVWLAISDHSIIPFYEKYIQGHDVVTVHFSGALYDDRLISVHPLMSFGPDLYSDEVYHRVQFGLTGVDHLDSALPDFKNAFFKIPAAEKPLYHAMCVMAGNFPQLLWSQIYQLAETHQIPFSAFDVYLKQITENFIRLRGDAVTGPLVRGDVDTVEKNIQSLAGTPLQNIYQTFKQEFLK